MSYTQQKYRIGIFEDNKLQNVVQINVNNDPKNSLSHYNYVSKQEQVGEIVKKHKT